ncbi:SOS mutagenesis protein UmuD [Acetobacter malorum DSM 14337]|uniref:SOS mutagenesis protein UmuD n=1 Tax=Acetobacter malorum DSM 14337 TaxID=1307910 RepID=A0ABQ0PYQ9_9PROT|nr:S24 family peptidase [Acetobacter malorum]KXV06758.1 error-prone repair protein UmuD [Acetobacter malorum]GBQ84890.1 SOS mutagenesis protein UmuD [Acetobacter malorum DSM 14337]
MTGYVGDKTTGFASPASDAIEGPIDLTEILDLRRPSRYPVRVRGRTFFSRGILDGDVLIADTAGQRASGQLVIASVSGQPILAELRLIKERWWLVSGDDSSSPILVDPALDVDIWACVTGVVREHP